MHGVLYVFEVECIRKTPSRLSSSKKEKYHRQIQDSASSGLLSLKYARSLKKEFE